ncbi:MAG: hypothetical protein JW862_11530 [Anaerolineales bacterium]|nr:hypothetical protein [Anaerolineales bacterium]
MVSILACNALFPGSEDLTPWSPENATEYTAEVQYVWDVWVGLNPEGYVAQGEISIGATATMRYQLRFWDAGTLIPGKGDAAIYRIYNIKAIDFISDDLGYSDAQEAALYARRDFPESVIKLHELTFTGGPRGKFMGTNSETGNPIYGSLKWNEAEQRMYAIFTEDIQQNYLVLSDEPFYNWP